MVGNSLLRQEIDIPVETDPALFWSNLFLYTPGNEYMSEFISTDKVKARHFHATKRFIDDLGTLNDRGLFNDIHKNISPLELQLKVAYYVIHTTFLNLDITVKDELLVCKLFDKSDGFPFLSFACFTLIVTSPNQYILLLLLENFLE